MRGVDHNPFRLAPLACQFCENLVEHAQAAPANEPIVDCLVRAILWRRVAPAQPVPDHKHDRAHDPTVVHARDAMRQWKIPFNPTHLNPRQQEQISHRQSPPASPRNQPIRPRAKTLIGPEPRAQPRPAHTMKRTYAMSKKIILITGASSGFGRLTAEALAKVGHTVYASMRDVVGRNAQNAAQMAEMSARDGVDLRAVELDVQSEPSTNAAVEKIVAESGRIDVVVHNAGHMMFGPAEAFTPEQYGQQYDVNVLGTQRVNRAVLPHMRAQKQGLLVWVSSSSTAGGTPPYLSPYFAAKAAMDALAVQYARELARWGIETSIVVPGAFTKGTNHFDHSVRPPDQARLAEYEAGPYKGFGEEVEEGFVAAVPDDADVLGVADEIVEIVDTRFGKRPFRMHYDPTEDGANVGFTVLDRLRAEMLHRVGLSDLLKPAVLN